MERPYQELLDDLPGQAVLNVDETGHKQNGQRMWTWCFRASLYTLFKIDPTRSADVLIEVLGEEFDGVLGCDYFSAYRRYHARVRRAAPVLPGPFDSRREVPDDLAGCNGTCLRRAAARGVAAAVRGNPPTGAVVRDGVSGQLEAARAEVLRSGTTDVPETRHSQNLAKRLEKHGESYFRFVTTPGVEPTNNLAEQAIRFVVIDRLITQGTRSEEGNRWCERIWTVIATCAQQGRRVFDYLYAAVGAWFEGTEAPSLLPEG